jgi:hypothetical protein
MCTDCFTTPYQLTAVQQNAIHGYGLFNDTVSGVQIEKQRAGLDGSAYGFTAGLPVRMWVAVFRVQLPKNTAYASVNCDRYCTALLRFLPFSYACFLIQFSIKNEILSFPDFAGNLIQSPKGSDCVWLVSGLTTSQSSNHLEWRFCISVT